MTAAPGPAAIWLGPSSGSRRPAVAAGSRPGAVAGRRGTARPAVDEAATVDGGSRGTGEGTPELGGSWSSSRPTTRPRTSSRSSRRLRGRAGGHVLVVDDDSPDGTGDDRRRAGRRRRPQVHVLHRTGSRASARRTSPASLGPRARLRRDRARWTPTARTSPSSCPGCSPRSTDADLVLGSRWVRRRGGQLAAPARCSPRRQPLRAAALGVPLRDATGGYRASAATLEGIDLDTSSPRATASRSTWPGGGQGRAAGGRGADHVRRAGARRVQDEPRHRPEALWRITGGSGDGTPALGGAGAAAHASRRRGAYDRLCRGARACSWSCPCWRST